jgi:hypothetical protein
MSHEKYKPCIDACYACAIACEHCASEDLKEDHLKHMVECVKLDLECAAFCRAAAEIMSKGGQFVHELCELCAKVCDACAAECEKHSDMEHCKTCAEACRTCATECRAMA